MAESRQIKRWQKAGNFLLCLRVFEVKYMIVTLWDAEGARNIFAFCRPMQDTISTRVF